jgi:hypothetical protein
MINSLQPSRCRRGVFAPSVFLLRILQHAPALIIGLCFDAGLRAQETEMVVLATVKARPVAMGGAFTSVRDDLASLDFNPAAFRLDRSGDGLRFQAFISPLGPWLSLKNRHTYTDGTVPLGLCIRGLGLSAGPIDAGILMGEESLSDAKWLRRNDPFDANGYPPQRNASFGFSFALTQRASLGAAGEWFIGNKNWKNARLGYRYGLILQPRANVSVGLFYMELPDTVRNGRSSLENLSDGTLNIGVSMEPWRFLRFSLDIRNVSDEDKPSVREPHAGLELFPCSHLVIRGGYSRSTDGRSETASWGAGICDLNQIFWADQPFTRPFYGLQTGWAQQKTPAGRFRWFFLTCLIRIG